MTWGLFVHYSVTGELINQWLASFDLDAVDPVRFPGGGTFTFTADPAQALAFESCEAAMAAWKRPATVVPVRVDGRPNRPLTQFTVSPTQLEGT